MEKPFTLKVQEIEEEIVKILNNSNLPAYVLKTVLQNLFNQLQELDNNEINTYLKNKENKKEKE